MSAGTEATKIETRAEIPRESNAAPTGEEARPSRWSIELLFWGLALTVLGHVFYGRLGPGLTVSPHGGLGRLLALLGAAFVTERAGKTRIRPALNRSLTLVCLAVVVWIVAWLWSRMTLVISVEASDPATLARRTEGLIGLADCVLILSALRLAERAGGLPRPHWARGSVVVGLSGLAFLLADLWFPRSWAFVLGRLDGTARAWGWSGLQSAWWLITLVLLIPVRRLREVRWPKAPGESLAAPERPDGPARVERA